MSPQDKEKEIEKLLREGVTWDQICKRTHSSANTVSKVNNRIKQAAMPKSNRTKALEMYNQGKTTYQVATGLDISAQEAERYQLEYWKLKGMNELREVYQENDDSIKDLVDLFYELDARGMNVSQVFEALKKVKSIGYLKAEEKSITEGIQFAQYRLDQLRIKQQRAEYQLKSLQDVSIAIRRDNANLVGSNQLLHEENKRNRSALHAFLSSNGYSKLREVARSEILTVMKFDSILIPSVAASVVKALTTYPELQSLLSYPYASEEIYRVGSNPNLPTTESQLLEESRNFFYQIEKYFIRRVTNDSIDTFGRNLNVPVYS